MPINEKYPLAELLEACRQYPLSKRKRIMIEYILLETLPFVDPNDPDTSGHVVFYL